MRISVIPNPVGRETSNLAERKSPAQWTESKALMICRAGPERYGSFFSGATGWRDWETYFRKCRPEICFFRVKCSAVPKLLDGKTAIVLGVWNKWSIAYAIAHAFVREGATLLLTYQNDRAKPTVEELGQELGAIKYFPCDVQQQPDIDGLAAALQSEGRKLDIVVHSLAFANHEDLNQPFVNTSRAGFHLAMDVSAYSLVAVARALQPLMTAGGAIMTLTYLGSTRVVTNYNIMGIAKAALEAEVKYLASELGANKIRVNAISAGPIKTISARGIKDFSKVLDFVSQHAPLRRNTDPAEVADAAVFLASDLGRGVTGNILFVDAGFHIMGLDPPK